MGRAALKSFGNFPYDRKLELRERRGSAELLACSLQAERDGGVEIEALQDGAVAFGFPGAAGGVEAVGFVLAHEDGFVGGGVGFDVTAPIAVGVAALGERPVI